MYAIWVHGPLGCYFRVEGSYGSLIKQPWIFSRLPFMNPDILGSGFLNQVPTLGQEHLRFRVLGRSQNPKTLNPELLNPKP